MAHIRYLWTNYDPVSCSDYSLEIIVRTARQLKLYNRLPLDIIESTMYIIGFVVNYYNKWEIMCSCNSYNKYICSVENNTILQNIYRKHETLYFSLPIRNELSFPGTKIVSCCVDLFGKNNLDLKNHQPLMIEITWQFYT